MHIFAKRALLIMLLAVVSFELFAAPKQTVGSTEELLICIPMTMNNVGRKYDLSGTLDPQTSTEYGINQNASNSIFRLYSTLETRYTGIGSTGANNGEAKFAPNYSSNDVYTITLTPHDANNGWNFIHETNWTSKRPFELDVATYVNSLNFQIKKKNGADRFSMAYRDLVRVTQNTNVTAVSSTQNSFTVTATEKPATLSFDESTNTYTLTIHGTQYYGVDPDKNNSNVNEVQWMAELLYYFDIYMKLPAYSGNLEPGIYSAAFDINVSIQSSDTASPTENIWSDTAYVYGFYGYDATDSQVTSNFLIMPTSETHQMNLRQSNTSFNVASLHFGMSETTTTTPYTSTTSTTLKDQYQNKYTVYISPTADYRASGSYTFVRMGTENYSRVNGTNTIRYSLSLVSSSAYNGAFGSGTIKGVGSYGSGGTDANSVALPSTTYYIKPSVDVIQSGETHSTKGSSSSSGSGTNMWVLTWELENIPLYLRVNPVDITNNLQSGIYYSYVYFTVETKT